MKLSVKPLKKNKTESGRSKEDKPHRDVCNRACIFYIFFSAKYKYYHMSE